MLHTATIGEVALLDGACCHALSFDRPSRTKIQVTMRAEPLKRRMAIDPQERSGRPCAAGRRIVVDDALSYLAPGMSQPAILKDFPELKKEDAPACLAHAVRRERLHPSPP